VCFGRFRAFLKNFTVAKGHDTLIVHGAEQLKLYLVAALLAAGKNVTGAQGDLMHQAVGIMVNTVDSRLWHRISRPEDFRQNSHPGTGFNRT